MRFQSTRFFLHVVPEPSQVTQVHSVAQLQMDDPQTAHHSLTGRYSRSLLLLHAWIHSQEDVWSLNQRQSERWPLHLLEIESVAIREVTSTLVGVWIRSNERGDLYIGDWIGGNERGDLYISWRLNQWWPLDLLEIESLARARRPQHWQIIDYITTIFKADVLLQKAIVYIPLQSYIYN